MPKYNVTLREIWDHKYQVEAGSEDEAIENAIAEQQKNHEISTVVGTSLKFIFGQDVSSRTRFRTLSFKWT